MERYLGKKIDGETRSIYSKRKDDTGEKRFIDLRRVRLRDEILEGTLGQRRVKGRHSDRQFLHGTVNEEHDTP